MSLLDKLVKNSTIKLTAQLSESKVFGKKEMSQTPVPMVNVALSGDVDGGQLATQAVGDEMAAQKSDDKADSDATGGGNAGSYKQVYVCFHGSTRVGCCQFKTNGAQIGGLLR